MMARTGIPKRGLRSVTAAPALSVRRPASLPPSVPLSVPLAIALMIALTLGGAVVSGAQGRPLLRGTVRDESGRALAGARATAIGTSLEEETDEAGGFTFVGLSGPHRIVARRIGFAPETASVSLAPSGPTLATVTLRRVVLPLEAVRVLGRRDLRGPIAGFYSRLAQGNGRFFTQEQLARRNLSRMSELLRTIPGVRVSQLRPGTYRIRMRGATTGPAVWLDGVPLGGGEVDLDNFDPRNFAGIEVYSGSATVPIQFSGSLTASSSGGAVVLWTRQGEAGPPRRRRGALTAAALVAQLLERGEAFTAAEVATTARLSGADQITPVYPDSLFAARMPGHIEVEFVVNEAGRVRMDTFGVISTTNGLLGESVRRALEGVAYVPATRGGRPVAQLVQLPFEYVPDSLAGARKPED